MQYISILHLTCQNTPQNRKLSGWKDYGIHQHLPQLQALKVRFERHRIIKSCFEYIMTQFLNFSYSALCQSAQVQWATISSPFIIIYHPALRIGKFHKKVGNSQNSWEKLWEFHNFSWEICPDPSSNTESGQVKAS